VGHHVGDQAAAGGTEPEQKLRIHHPVTGNQPQKDGLADCSRSDPFAGGVEIGVKPVVIANLEEHVTRFPYLVGDAPDLLQVREVGDVADGVIVGSALVRHLEATSGDQRQTALASIAQHVGELVASVGENIQICRVIRWVTEDGRFSCYLHLGGKIGVLVETQGSDDEELLNDVCMHIAAFNPSYIVPEDVPEDVLAKEREIAAAQMAGKPAEMMDKIVQGKISKWYTEVYFFRSVLYFFIISRDLFVCVSFLFFRASSLVSMNAGSLALSAI